MAQTKLEGNGADRHDLLFPPRHRLFVAFDDREHAEAAMVRLKRDAGVEGRDVFWVFAGDRGAAELDADGSRHGTWGRVVRFLQLWFGQDDVEYLGILEEQLGLGHVVLAIFAPDEESADQLARLLHSEGGHSFAYSTHWDFVPVLNEPAPTRS